MIGTAIVLAAALCLLAAGAVFTQGRKRAVLEMLATCLLALLFMAMAIWAPGLFQ